MNDVEFPMELALTREQANSLSVAYIFEMGYERIELGPHRSIVAVRESPFYRGSTAIIGNNVYVYYGDKFIPIT